MKRVFTSPASKQVKSFSLVLVLLSVSPWTNREEQQPAFKVRPQRGVLCHEAVVVTPQLSLVIPEATVCFSKMAGDHSFPARQLF